MTTLSGKWDKCIFRSCHTTIWQKQTEKNRKIIKKTHTKSSANTYFSNLIVVVVGI